MLQTDLHRAGIPAPGHLLAGFSIFVQVHLFSDEEIKGNMGQTQGWQFSWKQIARRSAGMALCGNCASTTGAELHHVY